MGANGAQGEESYVWAGTGKAFWGVERESHSRMGSSVMLCIRGKGLLWAEYSPTAC